MPDTTQESFWAAVPYSERGDGEAEVLSPWEQRHELHECLGTGDGTPSWLGYAGELKVDGKWHSLWQFSDRAKAEEFAGMERVFTNAQLSEFVANGQWCRHNDEEDDEETSVVDAGYVVIAEGVWLYDGSVPRTIELLRRPVQLASDRWIERKDGRFIIDIDSPIPVTSDGYVYYVGATAGGEFNSEQKAKQWADRQPWGPVRWEAVEPRPLTQKSGV